MPSAPADFSQLLIELASAQVKFVVVGGVAAFLQGAPVYTVDLDLVHARDEVNVKRLVDILNRHHAYYREHPDGKPAPNTRLLQSEGHHLLATDVGAVDVLGVIGDEQSYDDLVSHSRSIAIDEKHQIHVLSLQRIIEIKERLGRDKDRATLEILRRTLQEISDDVDT